MRLPGVHLGKMSLYLNLTVIFITPKFDEKCYERLAPILGSAENGDENRCDAASKEAGDENKCDVNGDENRCPVSKETGDENKCDVTGDKNRFPASKETGDENKCAENGDDKCDENDDSSPVMNMIMTVCHMKST